MLSRQADIFAHFRRSNEGSIAIIFALTTFIILMVSGLAIDYGRAMHAERKLAGAVDAAALAAAKVMRDSSLTDSDLQGVAAQYFEANMQGIGYAIIKSLVVTVDRPANAITVEVEGEVKTTLGQLAGIDKLTLPRSAVARFDQRDVEIGLQLDVTGSMCQTASGGSDPTCAKLNALKAAVGVLLDQVMPDGTTNVRVGLAPFSAGVNAGDYANAIAFGRATNGCVYERNSLADQSSEYAPTATGALSYRARSDLPPPPRYRSIQDCPRNAKLTALTTDREALRAEVNAWTAGGSTAGHLGTAWAWHLISPLWSSIWPTAPAAYNDGRTSKYAVLMTDGIYNTISGVNYGDSSSEARNSAALSVETCQAMKAKGITVFTIGLQVPASVKETLRSCANDSKFFDAPRPEDLSSVFAAIAAEITQIRLTN